MKPGVLHLTLRRISTKRYKVIFFVCVFTVDPFIVDKFGPYPFGLRPVKNSELQNSSVPAPNSPMVFLRLLDGHKERRQLTFETGTSPVGCYSKYTVSSRIRVLHGHLKSDPKDRTDEVGRSTFAVGSVLRPPTIRTLSVTPSSCPRLERD